MRRGKLSKPEGDYIAKHADSKPVADIARRLDRAPEIVEKHIKALKAIAAGLPPVEVEETVAAEISNQLRNTLEWKAVRKEFTREELDLFEEKYTRTVAHLSDLTPPELTQVHHQLKYEVLMHRNLVARSEAKKDAERMRRVQEQMVKDNPSNNTAAFREQLIAVEQQIQSLVSAEQSRTKEYVDLQKQHADLSKALKMTRDQRIKNLEEQASKASYVALLKILSEERNRASEGRTMELMRIAMENSSAELGEEFSYEDGSVDRPLKNAETVGEDE